MRIAIFLFLLFVVMGCDNKPSGNIKAIENKPAIFPLLNGVIIPPNIAPLNFKIDEQADHYWVQLNSTSGNSLSAGSSTGMIEFSEKLWRELILSSIGEKIDILVFAKCDNENWKKYNPVTFHIAKDSIDPYVSYRLLYPGYEGWHKLRIVQRCLENFQEYSILENQLVADNCVNCHSFCNKDPEKFLIHIRGDKGGTYFVDGDKVSKTNLKTEEMSSGAVYPSWHPAGRYVAFSSNKIVQNFYSRSPKNIEVYDLSSSLVLYDTETNEMFSYQNNDSLNYMETFPSWSPDGKYLYYCRALKVEKNFDVKDVKYNLVRQLFNAEQRTLGKPEIVYNAREIGKSVSFPKISPNGKSLVFTLHDYGTFSIWHKEADLYFLDLQNKQVRWMELNSDDTESYHCWSSNSKWLMFSSKRGDGLTARPYIAYVGDTLNIGNPFVLPQKDPTTYKRMLETFNIPEFITGKVQVDSRDFARVAGSKALKANWGGNLKQSE